MEWSVKEVLLFYYNIFSIIHILLLFSILHNNALVVLPAAHLYLILITVSYTRVILSVSHTGGFLFVFLTRNENYSSHYLSTQSHHLLLSMLLYCSYVYIYIYIYVCVCIQTHTLKPP